MIVVVVVMLLLRESYCFDVCRVRCVEACAGVDCCGRSCFGLWFLVVVVSVKLIVIVGSCMQLLIFVSFVVSVVCHGHPGRSTDHPGVGPLCLSCR